VEDLAGCATDDLAGWSERKDGETTKHAGILEELSREEADALIMQARVKMGWIKEEDLATPPAVGEPAEAGAAEVLSYPDDAGEFGQKIRELTGGAGAVIGASCSSSHT